MLVPSRRRAIGVAPSLAAPLPPHLGANSRMHPYEVSATALYGSVQ